MANDYIVKDIALADFGRKELDIAETEMPGLMSLREEYGEAKAAERRAHCGLAAHDHPDGVLIETLVDLGADVRWASCNIFSTQDHAAAAIAEAGVPVFAIKGQSLEEHWDYLDKSFMFRQTARNLILDDGGDATLYILLGARAEAGEDIIRRADSEEEEAIKAQIQKAYGGKPRLVHQDARPDPRRFRGNNNRRSPLVRTGPAMASCLPCDQRERFGHQVEVRQQIRL